MNKKFFIPVICLGFVILCLSCCANITDNYNNLKSLTQSYNTDDINTKDTTLNSNKIDDLEKLVKRYDYDLNFLKYISIECFNRQQYNTIIEIYTIYIKKYPQNECLYNNRGNIYKMLKKYDEAIEDYKKALSLNPKYVSPYIGEMNLYIMKGNDDKVLEITNKIIELEPKYNDAYYWRGVVFYNKRKYSNALNDFNLAIKFGLKNNQALYYLKGNILLMNNHYKLAIKNYRESIKIFNARKEFIRDNVAIADVYYNLGISYIRIGKFKKAKESLITAAEYYKNLENKNNLKEVEDVINQLIITGAVR